jgi:hypothetical protein
MVETTFGDGARAPSEPGQTSLDQQLQRKQGQAGATNSDATTTALEVTEAQPGRTSSSQPHTAGVPPPMFEQGVEWEKIPSDEYAVAG